MSDTDQAEWLAAIALAGRLAERGITRLTLAIGTHSRTLDTRTTDLPRELAQAPLGARLTWHDGAMIRDKTGWHDASAAGHPFG